jgi:hypothetical protein
VSTLLRATVYTFLHNLLNVLVQIANKMRLQKKSVHFLLRQARSRVLLYVYVLTPLLEFGLLAAWAYCVLTLS